MINDMTENPSQIENILESYEVVGFKSKMQKRTNRKNHDVSYAQAGIIPNRE